MRIPGYTAQTSLYKTRTNYRSVGTHDPGTGEVVPQLSRVCTECSGFFFGSRNCCDVEILYCNPTGPCLVNILNCQNENCGLIGKLF
jgi:hypothetical protein